MGSSENKSTTTQHQETGPWKPSQGILQDILGRTQGLMPSLNTTPQETAAFNTMRSNAGTVPNYGPQATGLANDLIASPDYSGRINFGFDALKTSMAPFVDPNNLDPLKNPGMAPLLETVRNDTANNINGLFAGAGRDLSGAHVNTLARGITSAEAPILLGQYNTNVSNLMGAADRMFNANAATAAGLSANDQQRYANRGTGLDIGVNGVPQAMNASAQNVLAVEDMIRQAPFRALGLPSALTLPIAGMGSIGDMTGTTTEEKKANPWQVGIGGAIGLAGLLGGNPLAMFKNPFSFGGGFGSER